MDIHVVSGNWGTSSEENITAILKSAADELLKAVCVKDVQPIRVE